MQNTQLPVGQTGRTSIKIDAIRIDGNTQGRLVIDQPTVYSYLERMKEGDTFPRISTVFDGQTHWLVDGFHRYHAYKLLGIKNVDIDYKPGTLEEAQVLSFGVNGTHGKPRANEDKRKVVQAALEHPLLKGKSDSEIARICHVSHPFVASIRNPDTRERQAKNRTKSMAKKVNEYESDSAGPDLNQHDAYGPSREEIEAAEEALKADQEMMYKLLDADDALATAHEEIKRLNFRVAQLEARLRGLMNERNEAVKMVKRYQHQFGTQRRKVV